MTDLSSSYWDNRYLRADTGWDIRQVSPPLQAYFQQRTDKTQKILIPGCGNAYEAAWLIGNGFSDITVLDFAPSLTAALRQQLPDAVQIITGDFFAHEDQYDCIIEQTFLCALDPALRNKYMEKMNTLLRPGGRLIGLLFDRTFPQGPPFGGNKAEYQDLLEQHFTIKTLEPCYNSIAPRKGTELFFIALKIPSNS